MQLYTGQSTGGAGAQYQNTTLAECFLSFHLIDGCCAELARSALRLRLTFGAMCRFARGTASKSCGRRAPIGVGEGVADFVLFQKKLRSGERGHDGQQAPVDGFTGVVEGRDQLRGARCPLLAKQVSARSIVFHKISVGIQAILSHRMFRRMFHQIVSRRAGLSRPTTAAVMPTGWRPPMLR